MLHFTVKIYRTNAKLRPCLYAEPVLLKFKGHTQTKCVHDHPC